MNNYSFPNSLDSRVKKKGRSPFMVPPLYGQIGFGPWFPNPVICGSKLFIPFDRGPQGGLVYGNNSYMYGTTYTGGKWGTGTIFRISIQGGDPEVLYDFRNGRPTGIQPKQCTTNPVFCKYSPEQRRDMSASYPISSPVLIGRTISTAPFVTA